MTSYTTTPVTLDAATIREILDFFNVRAAELEKYFGAKYGLSVGKAMDTGAKAAGREVEMKYGVTISDVIDAALAE